MLRPYQRELADACMDAVGEGSSPICCAPCGAGKTYIMDDIAARTDGQVLVVAHRRELLRQHEGLIGKRPNVRLASIFTEVRHLGEHGQPALILCDEAHLSEASSYLKTFRHYGVPVIGFTATPSRLDGRPLSAYNKLIQGVSADELIAAGHLAPYTYYAPTLYDVTGLQAKYGDYAAEDLESIVMRSALFGDVIKHYQHLAAGMQAIAYCSTVNHSQEVARRFNAAGIPAVHIDATSPAAVRQEALDGFRAGKYTVLCNVNLISEGISIPECGCVLGLRPTQSRALYIQQMCRALRYAPGKQAILIDFAGNVHRHGMPTADYKYSLDERVKRQSEFNEAGDYNVRICQSCFRTFGAGTQQCPYCGAVYAVSARELQQHQDIELAIIKAEEAVKEQKRLEELRADLKAARGLEDYKAIARKNGYKPSWAYVQLKKRTLWRKNRGGA